MKSGDEAINSVRRFDHIESLMSMLPEDFKSINTLLDFDNWEDKVSFVKDSELPRRESRTLRELWSLANQVYGYVTSKDDAPESSAHESRGKKRKKASDDSSSSKSRSLTRKIASSAAKRLDKTKYA